MGDMDQDKLGEWLSAYLDGELDAEERALVDRLLRDDETARHLYDELRRSVSLISSLPRQPAPPSIAEDVQAHAERATLLGDTELSSVAPQAEPRSRSPFLRILSMAAMVGLVAVGTWYVSTEVSDPVGTGQQVAMVTENRALAPVEKEEAKRGAAAEKTDGSVVGDLGQDLVAAAGFGQKLRNGMGIDAVLTHPFANEVVHLQVAVAGESNRDTVTAKLVAYLEGGRSIDLREITLGADKTARGVSKGAYHYEGKDGKNFSNEGERQILIRATREQLDGLLDELARATGDSDRIALSAGPLSMKGVARSRAALYGLEASPQFAYTTSDDVGSSVPQRTELDVAPRQNEAVPPGGLLEGVLRVAGIDPGMFRDLAAESAKPAAPGSSTASPGSPTDALEVHRTVGANRPSTSAASGELASTAAPSGERFAGRQGTALARESFQRGRAQPKRVVSSKSKRRTDAGSKKEAGASWRDETSSLVDRRMAVLDQARGSRATRTRPRDVGESHIDLAAPLLKDSPTMLDRLEAAPIDEYIILVVRVVPLPQDSGRKPPRANPRTQPKPRGPAK